MKGNSFALEKIQMLFSLNFHATCIPTELGGITQKYVGINIPWINLTLEKIAFLYFIFSVLGPELRPYRWEWDNNYSNTPTAPAKGVLPKSIIILEGGQTENALSAVASSPHAESASSPSDMTILVPLNNIARKILRKNLTRFLNLLPKLLLADTTGWARKVENIFKINISPKICKIDQFHYHF